MNPAQLGAGLRRKDRRWHVAGICRSQVGTRRFREPGDLLRSVGAALNALDRTEIEKMFKAAGATFWSRAGD